MPHGDLHEIEAPLPERLVVLTGIITTTTGGTIGSTDCVGCTVIKTGGGKVGRYTVTPRQKFKKLMSASVIIEGAADNAAAAAKGQVAQLRGVAVTTPILYLQVLTPSLAAGASVDVEVEDAAIIRFTLIMSRGRI